jgi:hypothetical protein
VPNERLSLRVPERCPSCGVAGSVQLEHTVKGQAMLLNWCCRGCGDEWPVVAEDERIERRVRETDRRRVTRKDRRKRN